MDENLAVRQPFGAKQQIPGTIRVENYDIGGEGFTYHDSTTNNISGDYRNDGVDIAADGVGGYAIVWTDTDEWLEYSVTVNRDGYFSFAPSIASGTNIGRFHLEYDGFDLTGSLSAPFTGGWLTFQPVTATNVHLRNGPHVIRFVFENGRMNLSGIQFNDVSPVLTAAVSTNKNIQLSIQTTPGLTNILEASTNLVNWSTVQAFLPTTNPILYNVTNSQAQRYYRISVP